MSAALEKPPWAAPCNGCGLCCRVELCHVAREMFPGAQTPCPALEFENGRAWCGLVRHPTRHLKLPVSLDAHRGEGGTTIGEEVALAIYVGQGCGMPDDWDKPRWEHVDETNMPVPE